MPESHPGPDAMSPRTRTLQTAETLITDEVLDAMHYADQLARTSTAAPTNPTQGATMTAGQALASLANGTPAEKTDKTSAATTTVTPPSPSPA